MHGLAMLLIDGQIPIDRSDEAAFNTFLRECASHAYYGLAQKSEVRSAESGRVSF
jgi:hypothetical protein